MNVRFIYFDVDDTLLDHRAAERAALTDLHAAFADHFDGHPVAHVCDVYHTHNSTLWAQYADGAIDKPTLKQERFERLRGALGVERVPAETLSAYYMERYATHWTFPEDARRAYERLAAAYPVGLLTNGFADVQRAKMERFPLLTDRAETVVISELVGHMKPHPAIFAHAAEAAGAASEAILYVGNSYRSDVRGSLDAGWQTAWYTRGLAPEAVVEGARGAAGDRLFCFNVWESLTTRLLPDA